MIYLQIFLCYFQIGLFSIGGGHASIPLVRSMVVDDRGWLTMSEFVDMITISEMTPGPFAINSATFVGIKTAGILGGALATLSCMLPSLMIIMLLATVYKKYRNLTLVSGALYGIRPSVTALIASAGLSLAGLSLFGTQTLSEISGIDWVAALVMAATFIILRKTKINSVLMILCAGGVGAGIFALCDAIAGKL